MSAAAAGGTALRVLRQLRRDPRTLALLVGVPVLLLLLVKYLFVGEPAVFDRIGAPMVGLFPFVTMFVVTSITMLRERTTGTLERLMTMPVAKLDLVLGYALAFAVVAMVQTVVVATVAFAGLGLDIAGDAWLVVVLAVANAILGMALGLFASAFARTEFQAVQFMPAFVLPQILLCGLFVARERMARGLELLSDALPLTYAFDALQRATHGDLGQRAALDAAVIAGAIALALMLGAATLRRRTP